LRLFVLKKLAFTIHKPSVGFSQLYQVTNKEDAFSQAVQLNALSFHSQSTQRQVGLGSIFVVDYKQLVLRGLFCGIGSQ
jgi:hypothetical protein